MTAQILVMVKTNTASGQQCAAKLQPYGKTIVLYCMQYK